MFLDIIHLVFCLKCHPVYISKHNISETGFYFHRQVKPTLLGPIGPDMGTSSVYWTQQSRFYLTMEIESSLRNTVF
jgi:hypothetical protein